MEIEILHVPPCPNDALESSLSCRLYRHDSGVDGAPTEAELGSVLGS